MRLGPILSGRRPTPGTFLILRPHDSEVAGWRPEGFGTGCTPLFGGGGRKVTASAAVKAVRSTRMSGAHNGDCMAPSDWGSLWRRLIAGGDGDLEFRLSMVYTVVIRASFSKICLFSPFLFQNAVCLACGAWRCIRTGMNSATFEWGVSSSPSGRLGGAGRRGGWRSLVEVFGVVG